MKKGTYISIDGAKLRASIKAARYSNRTLERILGHKDNYINSVCKRGRVAEADLDRICMMLNASPDDFRPTTVEAVSVKAAPAAEVRIAELEKQLADVIDVLERIANYTSQTNAKLVRICEQLL